MKMAKNYSTMIRQMLAHLYNVKQIHVIFAEEYFLYKKIFMIHEVKSYSKIIYAGLYQICGSNVRKKVQGGKVWIIIYTSMYIVVFTEW